MAIVCHRDSLKSLAYAVKFAIWVYDTDEERDKLISDLKRDFDKVLVVPAGLRIEERQ